MTACAAAHPAADNVIPWKALPADLNAPPPPAPHAFPIPAGTAPCGASDLLGVVTGSQGATGHIVTTFAFSASGSKACVLDGMPSVALLDPSGADLGFRARAAFAPASVPGPALVEPGPKPEPHTGLKFGQAGFNIDWISQPEACPGQNGSVPAAARIQVPTGGVLTIPIPTEPAGYPCQGVGVSTFEGPASPAPAPVVPPLPTIASLGAPATANAGPQFEFTVTLTNDNQSPLDLVANCPNYEEELFGADGTPLGGKHFYKLNCGPAGTLAVGQSARFQMRLDVPKTATPGTYRLVFMLGFWNAMTKFSPEQPVRVG
ncbi:MAG TPA: DUF4232 domain-containing protein [Candidatus Dormibacteraeota bacterium]|nr:DUF4232 domain-containing protein [Candidatus Dormibacteraeota bacterium]